MMKSINNISLITLILIFTIPFFSIAQNKVDTINNETIILMTKSNLSDKIILSKISTSTSDFDIGTDALIKLKQNNVSDTVINLMVHKQSYEESLKASRISKNSDGSNFTFTESGIYFKKDEQYIPLDPTVITSNQVGGFMSANFLSQIEGRQANYQLNNPISFYFNFENADKSLNNSNANVTDQDNFFQQIMNANMSVNKNAQAVSPNEFKLVKLITKKNKREYTTGRVPTFGRVDYSIKDNQLVSFKYEKISGNTYKITFPNGLKPGEYCFVYLSQSGNPYLYNMGQNNTKVFDFGVMP